MGEWKENNYNIPEIVELYKLNDNNIDKFAECAALAYKNYPLFRYITKEKSVHDIIKTIILSSISTMRDQVVGIADEENINAVALFLPPNYKGTTVLPFLLRGGIKIMFLAPPTTFLRLLKYENHAMKLKKQHTNHKSWYLYNVTVKPQFQSEGKCSKLLKPMFQYFDRTGQDCYLETHNQENISLYEHFGFQLLEVSNIPKTNVKHYSMIRKSKNKYQ